MDMFKPSRSRNTFYCFSPPVMLMTCIIEVSLAFYILLTYSMRQLSHRLVVFILILLAGFQGIEYVLCAQQDQESITFLAHLGYTCITLLPVLGLHLTSALVKRKTPIYVYIGYSVAVMWMIYFMALSGSVIQGQCGANYALLRMPQRISQLYAMYYIGLLIVGIWEAYTVSRRHLYQRFWKPLLLLILGYICILFPTASAVMIEPQTLHAIPSVMCGFALTLAVILACGVVPTSDELFEKHMRK